MKRLVMIGSAIAALAWGSVAAYASTETVTTASPWAYACGHTTFGTPAATKEDTPGTNDCKSTDVAGTANAALVSGTLTLSKLCGEADSAKCTADDLACDILVNPNYQAPVDLYPRRSARERTCAAEVVCRPGSIGRQTVSPALWRVNRRCSRRAGP